eukprot:2330142-Amphidinium_carterae.1
MRGPHDQPPPLPFKTPAAYRNEWPSRRAAKGESPPRLAEHSEVQFQPFHTSRSWLTSGRASDIELSRQMQLEPTRS